LGGTVPFDSDVPSVADDRLVGFEDGGLGAGCFAEGGLDFSAFSAFPSFPALLDPISRSVATGSTMPVRNITS